MQASNDISEEKHNRFVKWFLQHGGSHNSINYARFQPNDYIGIAAASDIKMNTIILAVPKSLIIGISTVKASPLADILEKYSIFKGDDNDDKDFNILALFIIMEKMKGQKSFFAPYLDCIEIAETLIHWTDDQIQQIGDPYLNVSFVNEIRADFEPTYHIFNSIVESNRDIFQGELTRELFDYCFGVVMTRCFGWGLPETMLVPYADFLNHHSNGVHHYAFSINLEGKNNQEYIKKSYCLDMSIFEKDNKAQLPIDYEKDSREIYIERNDKILRNHGIIETKDVRRIGTKKTREYLNVIRSEKLKESFDCQLLLSSDSEDNDSVEDQEDELSQATPNPLVKQFLEYKQYFKRVNHNIDARKDPKYIEPKPSINEEFQEDIPFDWWFEEDDVQFIVATSKNVAKGEQVYNSYGRRSNRFLLLWYGFTFPENKYDSVAFRLWNRKVQEKTGKLVFTRYLTEKDWKCHIPIGNKRYSYSQLSQEFRLKVNELNYYLIAFLRFRIIVGTAQFRKYDKTSQLSHISDLSLELQIFKSYKEILKLVAGEFTGNKTLKMTQIYRQSFAGILIESNDSILSAHSEGVEHILHLVRAMIEQPINRLQLTILYRKNWGDQSRDKEFASRMFVRHYYSQLHDFLQQ